MAIRNRRQLRGAQVSWGNLCQATQTFSESGRASRPSEIQELVSLHSLLTPLCLLLFLSLQILFLCFPPMVTLQPQVQVLNFSSSPKERHTVSISANSKSWRKNSIEPAWVSEFTPDETSCRQQRKLKTSSYKCGLRRRGWSQRRRDTGSQAQQTQVTAAVDESDLNGHRSPPLPCGRVTVALETPKMTSSR